MYRLIAANTHEEHKIHESSIRKDWLARVLFDQNAAYNDYRNILCDVTKVTDSSTMVPLGMVYAASMNVSSKNL